MQCNALLLILPFRTRTRTLHTRTRPRGVAHLHDSDGDTRMTPARLSVDSSPTSSRSLAARSIYLVAVPRLASSVSPSAVSSITPPCAYILVVHSKCKCFASDTITSETRHRPSGHGATALFFSTLSSALASPPFFTSLLSRGWRSDVRSLPVKQAVPPAPGHLTGKVAHLRLRSRPARPLPPARFSGASI